MVTQDDIRIGVHVEEQEGLRRLRQVQQETRDTADTAENQSRRMGDGWSSMWGKLAVGVGTLTAIGTGLYGVAKSSIDAEESASKFGVVFQAVLPAANQALEDLKKNYGLSNQAALAMLSGTGDLLTGLGMTADTAIDLSGKTQRLAVDLASFTNYSGGAAGASDALTKAMLGEREMLKSLGISIDEKLVKDELVAQGLDHLEGASLKAARAQVTLELAIQQSKNAVGDYERTADGTANRVKLLGDRFDDFKEAVGKSIIESDLFNNVLDGMISKFSDPVFQQEAAAVIADIAEGFADVASVAGPLLKTLITGVADVTRYIIDHKSTIIAAGTAYAAVFAIKKFSPFFSLIKKGLGDISTYYRVLRGEGKEFHNALGGSIDAVRGKTNGLGTAIGGMKGALKNVGSIGAAAFVGWQVGSLINDITGLKDAMFDLYNDEIRAIINSTNEIKEKHSATEFFIELRKGGGEAAKEFDRLKKSVDFLNKGYDANYRRQVLISKLQNSGYMRRYGSDVDFLTGAIQAGLTPTTDIVDLYNQKKSSIIGNKEALEKWLPNINELISKALPGEKKELGKIKKELLSMIGEKKKATKATQDYSKAAEALAKKLGILTQDGFANLSKETKLFTNIYRDAQKEMNPAQLEKLEKEVERLTKAYTTGGRDVPPALQEITEKINSQQYALEQLYPESERQNDKLKAGLELFKLFNPEIGTMVGLVNDNKSAVHEYNKESAVNLRQSELLIEANKSGCSSVQEYIDQQLFLAQVMQGMTTGLFPNYVAGMGSLADGAKDAAKKADGVAESLQAITSMSGTAIGALSDIGLIGEKTAGAMTAVNSGLGGVAGGFEAMTKGGDGITGLLGNITGGFSMVSSAISIATTLIDLFIGKSGELEAAERRLQGLSGTSEDWGTKIEELGKECGNTEVAFAKLFAGIAADSDITHDNFQNYVDRLRETFSLLERNELSAEETVKYYGEGFAVMVDKAKELGTEGGAAMTSLILLADEFNLSVKEIAAYEQANEAFGLKGYETYIAGQFSDVVFGMYEGMIEYNEKVADNQALVDGAHGLTAALEGHSNRIRLNEEQYQKYEDAAYDAYQTMIEQGFTAEEAAAENEGTLERLAYLQSEFGYSIDDTTLAMMQQAGVSVDNLTDQEKGNQILIDGFGEMNTNLRDMIDVMIDGIPRGIDAMAGASRSGFDSMAQDAAALNTALDSVAGGLDDIGSEIENTDRRFNNAVVGNTMVSDTETLTGALGYARGAVAEIGTTAEEADRRYGRAALDMSSTTRDLEKQYDATMAAMGESSAHWHRKLTEIKKEMEAFPERSDELQQEYDRAMAEMSAETEEFNEILEDLGDQLRNGLTETIQDAGDVYSDTIAAMTEGTLSLQEVMEALGYSLTDAIGLQGELNATGSDGRQYGIYTEEQKQEDSIDYKSIATQWVNNRNTVLQSEDGLRNMIRDLERLQVTDDLQAQYDRFLASLMQKQDRIEGGYSWTGKSWTMEGETPEGVDAPAFARGTAGWIDPPDLYIAGEHGPEAVESRGGKVRITPTDPGHLAPPEPVDSFGPWTGGSIQDGSGSIFEMPVSTWQDEKKLNRPDPLPEVRHPALPPIPKIAAPPVSVTVPVKVEAPAPRMPNLVINYRPEIKIINNSDMSVERIAENVKKAWKRDSKDLASFVINAIRKELGK